MFTIWTIAKTILETCGIWVTYCNSVNWEPELMTIFVTWQLIVKLDSIRNSCDVFRILLIFSVSETPFLKGQYGNFPHIFNFNIPPNIARGTTKYWVRSWSKSFSFILKLISGRKIIQRTPQNSFSLDEIVSFALATFHWQIELLAPSVVFKFWPSGGALIANLHCFQSWPPGHCWHYQLVLG